MHTQATSNYQSRASYPMSSNGRVHCSHVTGNYHCQVTAPSLSAAGGSCGIERAHRAVKHYSAAASALTRNKTRL